MPRIPRLRAEGLGRRLLSGVVLGALIAVFLGALRSTPLLESLELRLIDVRTRHFADERAFDPRIVIVQITESDVEAVRTKLGEPWPWPLEYNALIVRLLDEAGAAALMVDIFHLDRGAGPDDVPGTETGAEALPDHVRGRREGEAAEAASYGAAMKAFGKTAVAFELSANPSYELAARRAPALLRLGTPADGVATSATALSRSGAELPVLGVTQGATVLGFANVAPSMDGIVREAPLLGRWGERVVLSLPLATAQIATGTQATADAASVLVGDIRQRVGEDASIVVNFGREGSRGAYTRISAAQLLEWALPWHAGADLADEARTALRGKIVILGVNIVGLKDVLASPMDAAADGPMDGPVFQATVLDNILHGDGRVRAPHSINLLWLAALALILGAAGACVRGRLLPHLIPLAAAGLFTWLAYSQFASGSVLDLVTPLLAVLLAWGGTLALQAVTEGRRNRWLEGTFSRYMAPSLIDALKADPALLELGGRERHVSILFSDVAGFTGLAARLQPTQVVGLLNRYLTDHCDAVMDAGGVVDKFEGDAVMAFYGDPVPDADHALRACTTALRVQADLPRLQPTLDRLGVESFAVRIGINTGPAVVGNMGSEQRFAYTCMGDSVNLASRLEGAAKAFGAQILVGADTATAAGDALLLKPLGEVVVVGREEPVATYELLALSADAPADLVAHAEAFAEALAAATRGDLDGAKRALDEAGRLRPGDGPVAWFSQVLGGLSAAWDGRTVLTQK